MVEEECTNNTVNPGDFEDEHRESIENLGFEGRVQTLQNLEVEELAEHIARPRGLKGLKALQRKRILRG